MAPRKAPDGPVVTFERVEEAVRTELAEMDAWRRSPALSAAAVRLALILDETLAARDSAALANQLRITLTQLRDTPYGAAVETTSDRLQARRHARLNRIQAVGQ